MKIFKPINPTQVERHECLICYSEFQPSQVAICTNQHVICLNCQKAISRTDCLICSPQEISISIPQEERNTNLTIQPRARQSSQMTQTEDIRCLCSLVKYITIFWLLVYLGKVYFALFYYCNPQFDNSWLGWTTFRYILADLLCGSIVSAILFSCCCLSH